MIKITCIVGSARANGSSAYLVDTLLKGVGEGAEVKKYCVSQMNFGFCTGCKQCYVNGECVQTDEVKSVILDVLSSDYVVIAAPSYWAGVPAQLKALIDRSTPYGDTNPNRKYYAGGEIKGIAIAVRAGVREAENTLILDTIKHYFGHLGIKTVEKISVRNTDTLNDLLTKNEEAVSRVYGLGRHIAGEEK